VTITVIRSGTVITGDARTSLPDTGVVPADGVVHDLPHSDPDRSFGQADLIVAMASSHIAEAICDSRGELGVGGIEPTNRRRLDAHHRTRCGQCRDSDRRDMCRPSARRAPGRAHLHQRPTDLRCGQGTPVVRCPSSRRPHSNQFRRLSLNTAFSSMHMRRSEDHGTCP